MFVDSARVMWRWLRQGEMPEYLAEWKERKRRLKWSERPYYTPPRLLSLEEVAVIEKTNPSNVNDNADDEEEKEEDDDEEEEEEVVVVEDEEADALENLSEQQRHERELALEKEEPPPSTAVASPAAAVEAKVIFLIISIYLLED
jgi:DNA-directed RNA polymerase specialized sigma24 family protein